MSAIPKTLTLEVDTRFAFSRSQRGIGSLAPRSPTDSPARFSSKTATLLDFHDHQRHIIPLGLTIGEGRDFPKDAFDDLFR